MRSKGIDTLLGVMALRKEGYSLEHILNCVTSRVDVMDLLEKSLDLCISHEGILHTFDVNPEYFAKVYKQVESGDEE